MDKAIELFAALGPGPVDEALGLAAIAGRFADDDLVSILDQLQHAGVPGDVVIVDEGHSVQPGTVPAWRWWAAARQPVRGTGSADRRRWGGCRRPRCGILHDRSVL